MLVLTSTTDTLQAVLAGAHTTRALPIYATWRDITTTGYTPGKTVVSSNGTTAVSVVAAPAASTQRVVDQVSIFNDDTVSHTVTVRFNDNGTTYKLATVVLAVGEWLQFAEGTGWRVLAAGSGAVKTSLNQGTAAAGTGRQIAVLSADVTSSATANAIGNVTGLSFPVTAGNKYLFRFVIDYTSTGTASGSRWSINGPAFTRLAYQSSYSLTATSWTFNQAVAYDIPAASNATSAGTTGNIAVVEGIILPSANGDVIARFAGEAASSCTAKAGSFVEYEVVA